MNSFMVIQFLGQKQKCFLGIKNNSLRCYGHCSVSACWTVWDSFEHIGTVFMRVQLRINSFNAEHAKTPSMRREIKLINIFSAIFVYPSGIITFALNFYYLECTSKLDITAFITLLRESSPTIVSKGNPNTITEYSPK